MRIGVLAYGSLVEDAGAELEEATAERRSGVRTPFRVEFARHSSGRDGAPTLVPVTQGGAYVEAAIIVLKPGMSLDQAQDMVYRREIDRVGQANRYKPDPEKANQVYVEVLPNWERHGIGLRTVWYLVRFLSQNRALASVYSGARPRPLSGAHGCG